MLVTDNYSNKYYYEFILLIFIINFYYYESSAAEMAPDPQHKCKLKEQLP